MRVLRILALAGALGLAAPAAEAAPPPNDDFERATVLTPPTPWQEAYVSTDLTGATRQPNEPDHGGVGASGTVWYVFTALRDQRVATFAGGGPVGVTAVYTGDRLDALKPVAQVISSGAEAYPPQVAWQAVKQTTYRIAQGVNPAWRGYLWGGITLIDAMPRNDDFADAQPLRVTRSTRTYRGNINDATSEPGEPPIFVSRRRAERSVWFRFRVRHELGITVSAGNPDTYRGCFPVLSVYVGTRLRSLRKIATPWWAGGRVLARPGVPYGIALNCSGRSRMFERYWIRISGRPIRGAGLEFPRRISNVSRPLPEPQVTVTAWRPVGVAVELRVSPATARRLGLPGVRISNRLTRRVAINRPLSLPLRLTPKALAAVRRLRRLRVVLHAETLGGRWERSDVAWTLRWLNLDEGDI